MSEERIVNMSSSLRRALATAPLSDHEICGVQNIVGLDIPLFSYFLTTLSNPGHPLFSKLWNAEMGASAQRAYIEIFLELSKCEETIESILAHCPGAINSLEHFIHEVSPDSSADRAKASLVISRLLKHGDDAAMYGADALALEVFVAHGVKWHVYDESGHNYYVDLQTDFSQWEDPREHGIIGEHPSGATTTAADDPAGADANAIMTKEKKADVKLEASVYNIWVQCTSQLGHISHPSIRSAGGFPAFINSLGPIIDKLMSKVKRGSNSSSGNSGNEEEGGGGEEEKEEESTVCMRLTSGILGMLADAITENVISAVVIKNKCPDFMLAFRDMLGDAPHKENIVNLCVLAIALDEEDLICSAIGLSLLDIAPPPVPSSRERDGDSSTSLICPPPRTSTATGVQQLRALVAISSTLAGKTVLYSRDACVVNIHATLLDLSKSLLKEGENGGKSDELGGSSSSSNNLNFNSNWRSHLLLLECLVQLKIEPAPECLEAYAGCLDLLPSPSDTEVNDTFLFGIVAISLVIRLSDATHLALWGLLKSSFNIVERLSTIVCAKFAAESAFINEFQFCQFTAWKALAALSGMSKFRGIKHEISRREASLLAAAKDVLTSVTSRQSGAPVIYLLKALHLQGFLSNSPYKLSILPNYVAHVAKHLQQPHAAVLLSADSDPSLHMLRLLMFFTSKGKRRKEEEKEKEEEQEKEDQHTNVDYLFVSKQFHSAYMGVASADCPSLNDSPLVPDWSFCDILQSFLSTMSDKTIASDRGGGAVRYGLSLLANVLVSPSAEVCNKVYLQRLSSLKWVEHRRETATALISLQHSICSACDQCDSQRVALCLTFGDIELFAALERCASDAIEHKHGAGVLALLSIFAALKVLPSEAVISQLCALAVGTAGDGASTLAEPGLSRQCAVAACKALATICEIEKCAHFAVRITEVTSTQEATILLQDAQRVSDSPLMNALINVISLATNEDFKHCFTGALEWAVISLTYLLKYCPEIKSPWCGKLAPLFESLLVDCFGAVNDITHIGVALQAAVGLRMLGVPINISVYQAIDTLLQSELPSITVVATSASVKLMRTSSSSSASFMRSAVATPAYISRRVCNVLKGFLKPVLIDDSGKLRDEGVAVRQFCWASIFGAAKLSTDTTIDASLLQQSIESPLTLSLLQTLERLCILPTAESENQRNAVHILHGMYQTIPKCVLSANVDLLLNFGPSKFSATETTSALAPAGATTKVGSGGDGDGGGAAARADSAEEPAFGADSAEGIRRQVRSKVLLSALYILKLFITNNGFHNKLQMVRHTCTVTSIHTTNKAGNKKTMKTTESITVQRVLLRLLQNHDEVGWFCGGFVCDILQLCGWQPSAADLMPYRDMFRQVLGATTSSSLGSARYQQDGTRSESSLNPFHAVLSLEYLAKLYSTAGSSSSSSSSLALDPRGENGLLSLIHPILSDIGVDKKVDKSLELVYPDLIDAALNLLSGLCHRHCTTDTILTLFPPSAFVDLFSLQLSQGCVSAVVEESKDAGASEAKKESSKQKKEEEIVTADTTGKSGKSVQRKTDAKQLQNKKTSENSKGKASSSGKNKGKTVENSADTNSVSSSAMLSTYSASVPSSSNVDWGSSLPTLAKLLTCLSVPLVEGGAAELLVTLLAKALRAQGTSCGTINDIVSSLNELCSSQGNTRLLKDPSIGLLYALEEAYVNDAVPAMHIQENLRTIRSIYKRLQSRPSLQTLNNLANLTTTTTATASSSSSSSSSCATSSHHQLSNHSKNIHAEVERPRAEGNLMSKLLCLKSFCTDLSLSLYTDTEKCNVLSKYNAILANQRLYDYDAELVEEACSCIMQLEMFPSAEAMETIMFVFTRDDDAYYSSRLLALRCLQQVYAWGYKCYQGRFLPMSSQLIPQLLKVAQSYKGSARNIVFSIFYNLSLNESLLLTLSQPEYKLSQAIEDVVIEDKLHSSASRDALSMFARFVPSPSPELWSILAELCRSDLSSERKYAFAGVVRILRSTEVDKAAVVNSINDPSGVVAAAQQCLVQPLFTELHHTHFRDANSALNILKIIVTADTLNPLCCALRNTSLPIELRSLVLLILLDYAENTACQSVMKTFHLSVEGEPLSFVQLLEDMLLSGDFVGKFAIYICTILTRLKTVPSKKLTDTLLDMFATTSAEDADYDDNGDDVVKHGNKAKTHQSSDVWRCVEKECNLLEVEHCFGSILNTWSRCADFRVALLQPERRIVSIIMSKLKEDVNYPARTFLVKVLANLAESNVAKTIINDSKYDLDSLLGKCLNRMPSNDLGIKQLMCSLAQRLSLKPDKEFIDTLLCDIEQQANAPLRTSSLDCLVTLLQSHAVTEVVKTMSSRLMGICELVAQHRSSADINRAVIQCLGSLTIAPTENLLKKLVDIAVEERGATRSTAIKRLLSLSRHDVNQAVMAHTYSGVVSGMHKIAFEEAEWNTERGNACALLVSLQIVPNAELFISLANSLKGTLTQQVEALKAIGQLAQLHKCIQFINDSPSLGVMKALNEYSLVCDENSKIAVCGAIGSLRMSVTTEFLADIKEGIVSPSSQRATVSVYSLLSLTSSKAVRRQLTDRSSSSTIGAEIEQVLHDKLWNEASTAGFGTVNATRCMCILGRLGIMPRMQLLMHIVEALVDPKPLLLRSRAITALTNLASGSNSFNTQLDIAAPHFGIVPALLKISRDKTANDVISCNQLLMSISVQKVNIKGLVSADTPKATVDTLSEAEGDGGKMKNQKFTYTLLCMLNMAEKQEGKQALRAVGAIDALKPFYQLESKIGLYSSLILALLVGADESGGNAELLRAGGSTFNRIVDCLGNTVHRTGGEGYSYGIFRLSLVTKVISTMCISDANKRDLASPRVVGLLVHILSDFTSNSEGGAAGGGGDDVISAQLTVETLLSLSFLFEDDAELRGKLYPPESRVIEELHKMMDDIIAVDKLNDICKRNATALLNRLEPKEKEAAAAAAIHRHHQQQQQLVAITSATGGRGGGAGQVYNAQRQHVMVSYAWSDQEKVKLLCDGLRASNYDVWRDEEGSSIVEPMGGSTEERMAEAIESSAYIIVCVSRDYKERPNCRLEARYANQLLKKNRLKIIFAMMDQDYTTVSMPNYVDGWLAIMIGDLLWYPMWDEQQIKATASKLAGVIGSECKLLQPVDRNAGVDNALQAASPSRENIDTKNDGTASKVNEVSSVNDGDKNSGFADRMRHSVEQTRDAPSSAAASTSSAGEAGLTNFCSAGNSLVDLLFSHSAPNKGTLFTSSRFSAAGGIDPAILLEQMWAITTDAFCVVKSGGNDNNKELKGDLQSFLEESGIDNSTDLALCDEEDIERIAKSLKKIKCRRFLAIYAEFKQIMALREKNNLY